MKEYRNVDYLPVNLKKEFIDNKSFFDNVDGKSLDEQQRIACILNDCDLEIIAGAGTGKTQTLVAKSNYLIEKKGIDPSEILCLSFSTSSANDLNDRLNYPINTKTIHALGLSIINQKDYMDVLGERGFIEDVFPDYLNDASEKQLSDLKDYCEDYLASSRVRIKLNELESEEAKMNYLISNTFIAYKLRNFIDLFKGKDFNIPDLKKLIKKCDEDLKESKSYYKNMAFLNVVEPVFRYYQGYLSRNKIIDFNDMVNKAIKIIEKDGMSSDYKYIFVDEYQDMSYKNFQLVKAIKDKTGANLVVVGDDWQSIYGFRDSDLGLFTDFSKYFPDANRVFIEKTYRNPQQLINTAGKFIMKNEEHFKKSLKSDLSSDKPIKLIYHNKNENNIVKNLISNLSEDNDVLILGRHRKDIDEFLKGTDLIKKGRSKNHKIITDRKGTIENVEYRTIHKAKGLEADYAFIIQVIDDKVGFPNKLFPSYFMKIIHDWGYDEKLEEERRLFYVALTRAKKGVYIFTTKNRESEYVTELKEDSIENIEVIYSDDKSTYSHLEEFNQAKRPKKVKKSIKTEIPSYDMKKSIKTEIPKYNVENSNQIEIKAHLKDTGNKIIKSKDYDEAIDFYNKLLTNMFFLNDYYPYRKLVEVYKKKKEYGNVAEIIKLFFISGVYCNEAQLLWFRYHFKRACKDTARHFSEFEDMVEYFKTHGLKNRNMQNDPVPIAARIKTKRGIKVIPQSDFDEESRKKAINQNYRFENKYGTSKKALYYYEQLWKQDDFTKNLTAYKKLCSLYEDTCQYEKVIETANEYFKSNARQTKSSPQWFKRKIRNAKSYLGEDYHMPVIEEPQCKKSNVITVSSDNFSNLLSSRSGDEIIIKQSKNRLKFKIIDIENPRNIKNKIGDEVKLSISKDNFKIAENIGFDDILEIGHKNVPGKVSLKLVR